MIKDNNLSEYDSCVDLTKKELLGYLAYSQAGQGKVLMQHSPLEIAEELDLLKYTENGMDKEAFQSFLKTYLKHSQHMHHPHYMGHQVATPHLMSGVAEFINGSINNPMAIYEMGPSAAVIERYVINYLLEKIGWIKKEDLLDFSFTKASGVLTHGGSLANLTALLSARAHALPDSWDHGIASKAVFLAPEVSHYSVARAAAMMGLGSSSIVKIDTTPHGVMIPESLEEKVRQCRDQETIIIGVVADACCTASGLYDPIDEIADITTHNKIWLHIDGAHGASALLSEKHKHRLKGIDRADSVIWDMHKMLGTNALCAAVLYKNPLSMAGTFQQQASYMFHDKEDVGFDQLYYAIECTKAALGTKFFMVLAGDGEASLADHVDLLYDRAQDFHNLVEKDKRFENAYLPQSNIVCFRHPMLNDKDQLDLRNKLVIDGDFYITTTTLDGIRYLRLSIMNPRTKEIHFKALLDRLDDIVHENY